MPGARCRVCGYSASHRRGRGVYEHITKEKDDKHKAEAQLYCHRCGKEFTKLGGRSTHLIFCKGFLHLVHTSHNRQRRSPGEQIPTQRQHPIPIPYQSGPASPVTWQIVSASQGDGQGHTVNLRAGSSQLGHDGSSASWQAEITQFIPFPRLFTDSDERILNYFGNDFAYNRTAVKENAWKTIVKIAPGADLLKLALERLYCAYFGRKYDEKEFMQANCPKSRTSVLQTIHQRQSMVELTGIDAESRAVEILGAEIVQLQEMIGPEDDQKAWAAEIQRVPYLILKILQAATSVPKILPITFELRAKLESHVTMANMLAPLYAQLIDVNYCTKAEGQDRQRMWRIDPLIGAPHAVMHAVREMSLMCQGLSRTTPETMKSFIKGIRQRYPEGGEPQDKDEHINRDNLLECGRGYVMIAEIYLECRVLKRAPKHVAHLVPDILDILKTTLINFKATWGLCILAIAALVCVLKSQKNAINEVKDAVQFMAPMTNISRMNKICDFIHGLNIQEEQTDFWELVAGRVFDNFGYISLT